jgi:rhamnogalacturonyl hydrolase YesR
MALGRLAIVGAAAAAVSAGAAAAAAPPSAAAAAPPSAAPADPTDIAYRAISALVGQPFSSEMWEWAYGPAIQMSTMWQVSEGGPSPGMPGQDWSAVLNDRLDQFIADPSSAAYQILNNITIPWNYAIGDLVGLMPIAYLSRYDHYNGTGASSAVDWRLVTTVADTYIMKWPRRLPDGTISRDQGWGTEPDKNASFLWSDDQYMGTTVLARLITHGAPNSAAYADFIAGQQVNFAKYMQSASGVYYHGYNFATGDSSCCFWGRANGWIMMAHAEIVPVLAALSPPHPLTPAIVAIWQRQAAGLAALQNSTDGRWHQVVDHPETFLETSVTAMTLYSLVTGVTGGWLDRATYDPVIRLAWQGLSSTVGPDGTVSGISCGTGIGTDVAFYEARSTAWNISEPGLGSVFRAARAYWQYTAGEQGGSA